MLLILTFYAYIDYYFKYHFSFKCFHIFYLLWIALTYFMFYIPFVEYLFNQFHIFYSLNILSFGILLTDYCYFLNIINVLFF